MPPPLLNKKLALSEDFQSKHKDIAGSAKLFSLPEKIIQFGAGGFMRSFADYFVDNANRQGVFNGRIVVVQSTGAHRARTLNEQDGLFTLCVQGREKGVLVEKYCVVSSISRSFAATSEWQSVLACAANPDLELVVSNTTEVGVVFDGGDSISLDPPRSFPGKLTAFLYERFKAFGGVKNRGLIIIPCELLDNNGDLLRKIVVDLSTKWELGDGFVEWIETGNRFCNSLVDRIVPGIPAEDSLRNHWQNLGYEDRLLTTAEVYSLWAIQGDEPVRQRLGFASANPSIFVAEDITPYRERKLRILNGAHTFSAAAGILAGNKTVIDNMNHRLTSRFIERLVHDEIVPALDVDRNAAVTFANDVMERFRNPFLQHQLINISLQSTFKMRTRNVPSIFRHYRRKNSAPRLMAFGFAAYLLFMRGVEKLDGKICGRNDGQSYPINDDQAGLFFDQWSTVDVNSRQSIIEFATNICSNEALWSASLSSLPGFVDTVSADLHACIQGGVEKALQDALK